MNEARRQFALGVAGVRLWYARSPLPGAAPSPDFDLDEPEVPETDRQDVPPSSVAVHRPSTDGSRQGLARLQGLLADATATGDRKAPEKPVHRDGPPLDSAEPAQPAPRGARSPEAAPAPVQQPEKSSADALAGQAIGFRWRFWSGEHWLLVSSCPDAASRGLEDRLAGNILQALGDTVVRTDALVWPVFSNPAVPGNDAAGAVEVVSAMAANLAPSRQLWLGIEPAPDDEEAAGAVRRRVCAALGSATVSFGRSLAALSSEPAGKRALWQALRQAGGT